MENGKLLSIFTLEINNIGRLWLASWGLTGLFEIIKGWYFMNGALLSDIIFILIEAWE